MSVTSSATVKSSSAAVKSSWAQIAKTKSMDSEAKGAQSRLKPGARGSLMCLCRGKVLAMLSHYGWLMVQGDVDHPSIEKHEGHVYLSKKDVEDGEVLLPGDIVSFHLYADEKGLGAERCSLEERAPSRFNADAAEFVPAPIVEKSSGLNMSANANEFVPSVAWSKPSPVSMVFAQLSHIFASDDEDDDEEDDDFVPMFEKPDAINMRADAKEFVPSAKPLPCSNVFARLSQVFASDEDDESDDDIGFLNTLGHPDTEGKNSLCDESGDSSDDDTIIKWHVHTEAPSLKARMKVKRSASPDGSTSAGTTSDSEGESSCDGFPVLTGRSHVARATMQSFRPPPGLSPPQDFRPPPGLILPWEVDDCDGTEVTW